MSQTKLKFGKDAGLLAYNDMSFYEIIDDGISSISIDWEEMEQISSWFYSQKRNGSDLSENQNH